MLRSHSRRGTPLSRYAPPAHVPCRSKLVTVDQRQKHQKHSLMSSKMEPRIGVGVFVMNTEGKFVLGKRKGSHGANTWALPGGHLEFGESFETCAEREILEETGLQIRDVRFLTATNSVFEAEGKHYVTIFMGAVVRNDSDQPQILEPEKCTAWEWTSWDELKAEGKAQLSSGSKHTGRELFLPLLSLIEQRPEFRV